jgi:hypothetical protein
MSVSAGLLPSTLLVPVPDALATTAGVALAVGVAVAVGVADGCAVGIAVGVAVGVAVGAGVGVAVGSGVADAAAEGEAFGAGEAVGSTPRLGVSVDDPLQAVKIAGQTQSTSAAERRRARNDFIVDQSQTRSDCMCCSDSRRAVKSSAHARTRNSHICGFAKRFNRNGRPNVRGPNYGAGSRTATGSFAKRSRASTAVPSASACVSTNAPVKRST